MTLQSHAEVIRPDRHPELAREIIENLFGAGAVAMRVHGFQARITQRKFRPRLLR